MAPSKFGVLLWSWNYAPEPTAMGPIATAWVRELRARGHRVDVVAGQPHYPPGMYGTGLRLDRQTIEGARVLRLPLVTGHSNALRRALEDASYAVSALGAAMLFRSRQASVVVSPSFLGLAPAIVRARLRREPWILWLQDILPDAATTTGLMREGRAVAAARALERRAYRSAAAIVVPSEAFRTNLVAKGVPAAKIHLVPNPAPRVAEGLDRRASSPGPPRLLHVGNVGLSQGLERVIARLRESTAEFTLRVAGVGERLAATRAAAQDDPRIQVLGFVPDAELARELASADAALVAQAPGVEEFNVPSRVAMLLGAGLPVVAVVNPGSEIERVVRGAGAGWSVDNRRLDDLVLLLESELRDPGERAARGAAGARYAAANLGWEGVADRFEELLQEIVPRARFTK